nr:hypothetical protein [Tanacetum cinerariifolium]
MESTCYHCSSDKLHTADYTQLYDFLKYNQKEIAQPGMNMGQDRQMQMGRGNSGNQFRQYAGQNAGNLAGYNDVIRNQKEEAGIQLQVEEYDLMAAAADLDEIEECDECKYDKISYDKAYKDMQQKIERLQAQLGDLKGKSKDTSSVSDTRNPMSQKLENKNVELEFQALNYARENAHLKATYKNLFDSMSVSRIDNTKTRRPQPRSNT